MTTTGELSEDLKGVIDRYLEGHRSRSLATLSRACGVSYTTIRRLYQREGNPTAEPVLKIADAALNLEEKVLFINRHYPEIGSTLSRFQKNDLPRKEPRQEAMRGFFMRDPHNFILNLAHNDKGTTVPAVRRLTGERGVEALEELIDHEILTRDSSNPEKIFPLTTMVSHDCDLALAQMKLSADHFDRSLIGTKAARIFHATAGVNHRALERIHDILSTAIRDIVAMKDDPRSSGDIPLFVDTMMNVYDKTPLNQQGRDA